MKKILTLILILTLVISVSGCTKEEVMSDAKKFKEEYESLNGKTNESNGKKYREVTISKDNPFIYSTAEEIAEKINNNETFVVYFGFKECPWCRSILEQLIKVAKDKEVDTIYYIDVKDIRDIKELDEEKNVITTKEGTAAYYELIEQMKDVLEEYTITDENNEEISTGESRIFAPNVVAVIKGKATQLESGISEEQTDAYEKITDKMKEETYNKFKCLLECLEKDANSCKKNMC